MRAVPIAGKEVAGKQQIKTIAVEAAMTAGMTWKMYNLKSTPQRQAGIGHKVLVDGHSSIAEHAPPDRFHYAAYPARSGVRINTIDMGLFQRVGENRSAGQLFDPGEISGVIEMTMREKNGFNVRPGQIELLQDFFQPGHFANQACVDKNRLATGCVVKQMKGTCVAAHGINRKGIIQCNIV